MKFTTATDKQRSVAICKQGVKDSYFKAALSYDPSKSDEDGHFDYLPKDPKGGDWLRIYREPHYPISKYMKSTPLPKYDTLYIQPIGDFNPSNSPNLERIREYASIFFQKTVITLPPMSIHETNKKNKVIVGSNYVTCRENWGIRQLNTRSILKMLKETKPLESHCVMGLTMEDLYPEDDWNYVFGEASPGDRLGIFSFARYSPLFYDEENVDRELTAEEKIIMLRRSINVMVHETGHMMGLPHCIYFRCMMNGANSLEESDTQPSYECPACLRKLQYHLNFDVKKRFEDLLEYYTNNNLTIEKTWLCKRMTFINTLVK